MDLYDQQLDHPWVLPLTVLHPETQAIAPSRPWWEPGVRLLAEIEVK